mmetsp:Transcript_42613/g.59713  ORF Transcript_42613/g.59713 Transcript_42613/m.59713 type:complete len:538 (+) Transcript_42613:170-1783(+)
MGLDDTLFNRFDARHHLDQMFLSRFDSLVKKRRLISDEDPENELEETLFSERFGDLPPPQQAQLSATTESLEQQPPHLPQEGVILSCDSKEPATVPPEPTTIPPEPPTALSSGPPPPPPPDSGTTQSPILITKDESLSSGESTVDKTKKREGTHLAMPDLSFISSEVQKTILCRTTQFISSQGGVGEAPEQMLKQKQKENKNFSFLFSSDPLYPTYVALVSFYKHQQEQKKEEPPHDEKVQEEEEHKQHEKEKEETDQKDEEISEIVAEEGFSYFSAYDDDDSEAKKEQQEHPQPQPQPYQPQQYGGYYVSQPYGPFPQQQQQQPLVKTEHEEKAEEVPDPPSGVEIPPKYIKMVADRLARNVAQGGQYLEQLIKQKEINNPRFEFLLPWSRYRQYYEWVRQKRIEQLQNVPTSSHQTSNPSSIPPKTPLNSTKKSQSSSPLPPSLAATLSAASASSASTIVKKPERKRKWDQKPDKEVIKFEISNRFSSSTSQSPTPSSPKSPDETQQPMTDEDHQETKRRRLEKAKLLLKKKQQS